MNDAVRLTIQVAISALIIFGGLWWAWRRPGQPVTDSAAAPIFAFISVWIGVASVIIGAWLWFANNKDLWVPIHVGVWSLALTLSGLTFWIYRKTPVEQMPDEILMQRAQARVGLLLGLLGVILWYIFILTHKAPLTPIGP